MATPLDCTVRHIRDCRCIRFFVLNGLYPSVWIPTDTISCIGLTVKKKLKRQNVSQRSPPTGEQTGSFLASHVHLEADIASCIDNNTSMALTLLGILLDLRVRGDPTQVGRLFTFVDRKSKMANIAGVFSALKLRRRFLYFTLSQEYEPFTV